MKVLMLGGTGVLGSGVVARLSHNGHDVVATSRGNLPAQMPDGAYHVRVDRRDLATMRALVDDVRPDCVVDGIAYNAQDGRDDIDLFAGRVKHLVMISTDFVYKPTFQRLPIAEDAPVRAGTPYSEGKVDCEEVLLAQSELPATVLRPQHILGPTGRLGSGSMQGRDATLIDRLRKGVPVVLIDAGIWLLALVHVDDAGDAIGAVLGNDRCLGKAYNMVSDTMSTRHYYDAVAAELGVELRTLSLPGDTWLRANPDAVSFTRHRMYDLSRLKLDAGWEPRVTFEDAVARTSRAIIERDGVEPYLEAPAERAVIDALERGETDVGAALNAWMSGT